MATKNQIDAVWERLQHLNGEKAYFEGKRAEIGDRLNRGQIPKGEEAEAAIREMHFYGRQIEDVEAELRKPNFGLEA